MFIYFTKSVHKSTLSFIIFSKLKNMKTYIILKRYILLLLFVFSTLPFVNHRWPSTHSLIIKLFPRSCQRIGSNGSCIFTNNIKFQQADLSIETTMVIGGQFLLSTNALTYPVLVQFCRQEN